MERNHLVRPIIPMLIAMIIGIVLGVKIPGYAIWAYGFTTACFLSIGFHIIRHHRSLFPILFLFIGLGYLSIHQWIAPQFPPHHIIHFTDSDQYNITGVVARDPLIIGNRLKFVLKTESVKQKEQKYKTTGRIRVMVMGETPVISIGDRVTFKSRIRKIRNFNNPGGFDYEQYMTFQKIWGSAYTSANRIQVLSTSTAAKNWLNINSARRSLAALIDDATENPENHILKALIIGDRNGISTELRDIFNRTGTGHLLAISGLHIGIIATISFLFFQSIFSRVPYLLRQAWTRKGAAVLSIFPILAYGLIAGMSPSTQRAVIMIAVFLLTFLLEKDQDLINTLAVAAMIILIIHPPSLFSISFQLSFVAVLSIIYGTFQIRGAAFFMKAFRAPVIGRPISFLMVSALAILGTIPFTMFYFNQVSYVGLPANLIAVPMIGFGVVPLGLISAVVFPFTPEGATALLKLSSLILSYAFDIISYMSKWSFSASKTITPNFVEIGCYYILAWYLLNLNIFSSKIGLPGHTDKDAGDRASVFLGRKFSGGNQRHIRRTMAVAVLATTVSVAAIDVGYWVYERFFNPRLRVTFIDVGQGNSAVLEAPGGKIFLIDGGGFTDNSVFDVGAGIVAPLLWGKKIKTINTMILSHPNRDHYNGLLFVARHFKVNRIWDNGQIDNLESYHELLRLIKDKNIDSIGYDKPVHGITLDNLRVDILYPPGDLLKKIKQDPWRNTNNNSLVVRVALGAVSFLFPGDIQTWAEEELAELAGDRLKSSVLLAPHHGSKTSSSTFFLSKVDPEITVISCGWRNRFHFPHPKILRRYRNRGIRVFSTAENGAVTFVTDGRKIVVKPFKNNAV